MKLLDDLYYVLKRRNCEECKFSNLCEEGFVDRETDDIYNFCEILEMAKNIE